MFVHTCDTFKQELFPHVVLLMTRVCCLGTCNEKESVLGIVDDLTAAGVPCFGPSAKAAQLEASKSFSKSFMDRHNIPTARWSSFTDPQDACRYIRG